VQFCEALRDFDEPTRQEDEEEYYWLSKINIQFLLHLKKSVHEMELFAPIKQQKQTSKNISKQTFHGGT
jgi:hypothetical protein